MILSIGKMEFFRFFQEKQKCSTHSKTLKKSRTDKIELNLFILIAKSYRETHFLHCQVLILPDLAVSFPLTLLFQGNLYETFFSNFFIPASCSASDRLRHEACH